MTEIVLDRPAPTPILKLAEGPLNDKFFYGVGHHRLGRGVIVNISRMAGHALSPVYFVVNLNNITDGKGYINGGSLSLNGVVNCLLLDGWRVFQFRTFEAFAEWALKP